MADSVWRATTLTVPIERTPPKARFELTNAFPLTWRLASGVVVPIPT